MLDLDANRLEVAEKLVPRVQTVQVSLNETPKEVAEEIKTAFGYAAMLVFECTGVESSVQSASYSCRFGGMVFIIGCGKDFQNVPFAYMSARKIDLRFQYRYRDTYPKAIRLVCAEFIDLKPLVTHQFSLGEGGKAFKAASDPAARAIECKYWTTECVYFLEQCQDSSSGVANPFHAARYR